MSNTSSSEESHALVYLNLAKNVVTSALQLGAIVLAAKLLLFHFCRPRRQRNVYLTGIEHLYLWSLAGLALMSLPYRLYMTVQWSGDSLAASVLQMRVFYFLTALTVVYTAITPTPLLFLIVDRCMMIKRASAGTRGYVLPTGVFSMILVGAVLASVYFMDRGLQEARSEFLNSISTHPIYNHRPLPFSGTVWGERDMLAGTGQSLPLHHNPIRLPSGNLPLSRLLLLAAAPEL